jgi:hypothetical protein
MRNLGTAALSLSALIFVVGCGCRPDLLGGKRTNESVPEPARPANNQPSVSPSSMPKNAYRIKGSIDQAIQEGNVCDTSRPFTVDGTLKFEFSPKSPTTGEYTYSGPFNATGSGPYEIRPDGSMLVDGTGCIMGKCATYSHEWQAEPIDPATCKDGK